MTTAQTTPKSAPDFALHRTVTAVDSGVQTVKGLGMNMAGAKKAIVQVLPNAGDSPTVEVLFWSEEGSKFIKAHTPLVFAGVGDGVAYTFTVEVDSQIMLVSPTVDVVAGACLIMVAADYLAL